MKSIISFILAFSATAICFAQSNQTESLTISTYYPSPYGIYRNLKFTPTDAVPSDSALSPGVIYYNNTDDVLRYYNKTGSWVNLTGGGSGGYWAYNSATKDIYNTNQGKVIINGTESNDDILKVYGDVRVKNAFNDTSLYLDRAGAPSASSLNFIFVDPVTKLNFWNLGSTQSTIPYLIIGNMTPNDLTVYQVTVKPNGNVGLRTHPTEPFWDASAKLHIAGEEAGGPGQTLARLEGDGAIRLEMESASDNDFRGPEIVGYRARGSLSPGGELAVIDGDHLLEVEMTGEKGSGSPGEASVIKIQANGTFSSASAPGKITFMNSPSGYYNMFIANNGRVGIWSWPEDHMFEVWMQLTHPGTHGFVSDTGHWLSLSDRRLKKNISGIEDALAKISRVQGVRYDFITENPSGAEKGQHLGFIGQDLEKEFPEVVSTDSKGYKSVSYEIITPVLVEAIKEQQNQIEFLRKEIKILKSRKKQGRSQGAI